ncbi:MAG TPA: LytR C-terminal domain-containing protein [Gaiellaceae bacterium]|nr:LytR C-terminal domain-containing protein [Gaiellaceae bacterium]
MDHRADLPATPPWRSAAFIAVSVATVELVILLIVGIWLFGKFFSDEVSKATDPTTVARVAVERELKERGQLPQQQAEAKPDVKPLLSRREVSVLVLNGNGVTGAASEAAARVRAEKYLIAGTGNAASSDYPRSLVMYRPGFEREARRLAKDLGVRRVVPLDGMRPRALQGAHVALILGD